MSGPVVDLSLYKCNTRRRIHVSSLIQPFNTELRHTQRNVSCWLSFSFVCGKWEVLHNKILLKEILKTCSVVSLLQQHETKFLLQKSSSWEFALLRSRVNYHSFNITQEHLLQSIQFTLLFRPTTKKAFPLMVLFRYYYSTVLYSYSDNNRIIWMNFDWKVRLWHISNHECPLYQDVWKADS